MGSDDVTTSRLLLSLGLAAVVSLGAVAVYAHARATPPCDDEQVMGRVDNILRDRFQFDSILVNNIRTLSGGYFSDRHECLAEVTPIRGNINASDMPWREMRYSVAHGDPPERFVVTVTLGGAVPLAEPKPPLWKRLLGYQ